MSKRSTVSGVSCAALRAVALAALMWTAASVVATAADPSFTAEERRRLARLTNLPAEGDLDAAKLAAASYAVVSPEKLADFADADCAALARLPALGSLALERFPLTAACVEALAGHQLSIRLIDVEFSPRTTAALGSMPSLINLRIEGGRGLGPHLADAFPPTSRLVRVTLGRIDGEILTRLRHLPKLSELEIDGVTGDRGLAPLDGAPELERLSVNEASAADLAVIAGLPKLASLHADLAKGIDETALRRLTASKSLREISLAFADPPGAVGVGVLAEMPRLEHLRLVYQTVPDRELARLARSRSLTTLDLREATVSNAGLATLAESRSLRSVNLWRVDVSAAVRRKLKKRFEIE